MRSKRNLPVFLGYALLGLFVLGFLGRQMGGEFLFAGTYEVKAMFASAAELVPSDDVTVAGVRVGEVQALYPQQQGTEAVLLIHSQFAPFFTDARATIMTKNLLGERYVEIYRGTDGQRIPNGGMIDVNHTLTPVEVDQVLNALGPDVRQRLAITINTLGEAVAGQGPDLNQQATDLVVVAASLRSIAATLASNSADLGTLLDDLNKVLATLAAYHAQFRQLLVDWDRLMQLLEQREAALQGTIVQEDQVMAIFNQAFSGTSPQAVHAAIAAAPAMINSTNQYLNESNVVFGGLNQHSVSISNLFYELASVMSGYGPDSSTGRTTHMWRVYCVAGCIQSAQPGSHE